MQNKIVRGSTLIFTATADYCGDGSGPVEFCGSHGATTATLALTQTPEW